MGADRHLDAAALHCDLGHLGAVGRGKALAVGQHVKAPEAPVGVAHYELQPVFGMDALD